MVYTVVCYLNPHKDTLMHRIEENPQCRLVTFLGYDATSKKAGIILPALLKLVFENMLLQRNFKCTGIFACLWLVDFNG